MVLFILGAIVAISSFACGNCWGIVCGLIMVLGAAFFGDHNYQK